MTTSRSSPTLPAHLEATQPATVPIGELRIAGASNGYTAVSELELWVTDAGEMIRLETTVLGDPDKPQTGPPHHVRLDYRHPTEPHAPINAPEPGTSDNAINNVMWRRRLRRSGLRPTSGPVRCVRNLAS